MDYIPLWALVSHVTSPAALVEEVQYEMMTVLLLILQTNPWRVL